MEKDINIDELSVILEWASSPDQARRELAERQIETYGQFPQFYLVLMDLYSNRNLDLHIRQLSLIIVRTKIRNEWKVRPPIKSIFTGIKEDLKKKILNSLDEQEMKLASQITCIIGHIVGSEYPSEWPDALALLCSESAPRHSSNAEGVPLPLTPLQLNTLNALKDSLDTLCAKVLPSMRRAFFESSPNILCSLYANLSNQLSPILQELQTNPQLFSKDSYSHHLSAYISRLSALPLYYKCLRRVTIYALRIPEMRPVVDNILMSILGFFIEIYRISGNVIGIHKAVLEGFSIFIYQCMKTFNEVLEIDPNNYPFLQIAPTVLLLYLDLLVNMNMPFSPHEKRCCMQFLTFIRMVLQLASSNKSLDKFRKSVLTPDRVRELVLLMTEKFLYVTDEDIEIWNTHPSEYFDVGLKNTYSENLHVPCKDILQALTIHYRKNFVPELIEEISKQLAAHRGNNFSVQNIRKLDGLLCVIGCVAETLPEFVDIDEWLTKYLVPRFPILLSHEVLKYRLAWLLGRVVHLKETGEFYLYYSTLVDMMGCESVVLKITAAASLQLMVEDLNFRSREFETLLQVAIERFLALLDSVDDEMLKSKVILYMSDIMERMERMINPYAVDIMKILSKVWDDYPDSIMLRSEAIRALSKFVKTLNKINPTYTCSVVINILRLCLVLESDSDSTYLEDSLGLWMSMLVSVSQEFNAFTSNNPAILESAQNLLYIFPSLLDLMARGTEYPEKVLSVLKVYFLISPKFIINKISLMNKLKSHANRLFSLINLIVSNLRVQSIYLLFECTDIILLLSNCDGAFAQVETSLIESGFLEKITMGLIEDVDLPGITTGYLILLARIILCDPMFVVNYISYVAETHLQYTRADAIRLFIDIIQKKCGCLVNKIQSRICGMAAITLITTEDADIIQNSHKIFAILASVFEDAELINTDDNNIEDEEETQKTDISHRNARSNDPVYTQLSITNLVKVSVEDVLSGPEGENLRAKLQLVQSSIPPALKDCLTHID